MKRYALECKKRRGDWAHQFYGNSLKIMRASIKRYRKVNQNCLFRIVFVETIERRTRVKE